jgi:hypothetical protein
MTSDELHSLQKPEVLELIDRHADDDPSEFALKFHGSEGLPVRAIAEQIACRRKASLKLPTLSRYPLLYAKLTLEQASGERTAEWKAGLMSGRSIIDLTGGLGIDSIFLARRFRQVIHCERDPVLSELAGYNFRTLGIGNIERRCAESGSVLESSSDDRFDWIYVDPARREKGGRSAALEASSPDVVRMHDLLLKKAPRVCIKASPALETADLERKLPNLSSIVVVSVNGECKEVLLMLERDREPGTPPKTRAVRLDGDEYSIEGGEGAPSSRSVSTVQGRYLYEPDAAIIKARLTPELARRTGLDFLNTTVDYLTSEHLLQRFPGRVFRIEELVVWKPSTFGSFLEKHGIRGASIQRRDFPLSPDELRKKYRLRESSEVFLFFTKGVGGALICLYCRKP